ncbi:MAG: exodeoxyribonuclease VII small subunit [Acidobacteria bacterium]|nr:exodeoxyribonuclease VII small subunit [Acidobacteriota bacterium]
MGDAAPDLASLEITEPGDIPKGVAFEDAMAELEDCVDQLESGDVGLDEALRLFRRGAALQAWCEARLEAIRAQVEELTGGDAEEPGDS